MDEKKTKMTRREFLRAAGFASVRAFDATPFFGKSATMKPGHRTIYLARKGAAPGRRLLAPSNSL